MRKWIAFLAVATLAFGACSSDSGGGGSSEDPKAALISAFENLSKQQGGSITISLASTPESLAAVSEDEVTEDQANTILGSSVTIEGNAAEDPADTTFRLAVNIEGTDGAEIMVVGGDLFVRADVPGMASAFGADTSAIDQAAAEAEQAGFAFVRPFLEGQVVKFAGIQEALTGLSGGQDPTAGLGEQEQQLLDQFRRTIQENAEVTSEGSDDVGEHLVASVPLRTLVESLSSALGPLSAQLPPGSLPDPADVPEGDLSLDVWVADDNVAQIEFDFTQLAQFDEEAEQDLEGVDEFALRVAISDDVPELTAPEAGAEITQEDIQKIVGLFMGGLGGVPGGDIPSGGGAAPGGGGGGGGPAIDCSLYEGLPPETFEGLPQETLDQIEAICPGVIP